MWQYNYELYHSGIKGQKWGVRRFQNEDGSLTSAGKKRYAESGKIVKKNTASAAKQIRVNDAYKPEEKKIKSKDGNAVYVRSKYNPVTNEASYYKTTPFVTTTNNIMRENDIRRVQERTGISAVSTINNGAIKEHVDRNAAYREASKKKTSNEIKSKVNRLIANMKYGISKASKRLVETGTKMVQKLLSKLPTKTTMKFTSTTSVSSKEYDPISSPMNPRYRKNN